jgi:hypothetical protein
MLRTIIIIIVIIWYIAATTATTTAIINIINHHQTSQRDSSHPLPAICSARLSKGSGMRHQGWAPTKKGRQAMRPRGGLRQVGRVNCDDNYVVRR